MTARHTLDSVFAQRVTEQADGCWVMSGALKHHGYTEVGVGGKRYASHRYVYEAMVGPIPEGLELDHLCRNTSCVNPWHLEPVTNAENNRRRRRETCEQGHPLVEGNLYYTSRGYRKCRTCSLRMSLEGHRRRRQERRAS